MTYETSLAGVRAHVGLLWRTWERLENNEDSTSFALIAAEAEQVKHYASRCYEIKTLEEFPNEKELTE